MNSSSISRLLARVLATLLLITSGGCATTMAIIGPHEILTSDRDSITSEGEREERVRGAEYSPSTQAIVCESEWRTPRETVHSWHAGYDTGGRLALGFIGFGELLLGGAAFGSSVSEAQPKASDWSLAAAGGLLALDGIATFLLAILLNNFEQETITEREGRWQTLDACPADAELWLGGLRITPDAAGRLPLPKTLGAWSGSFDLSLRQGGGEFVLPLAGGSRCADAASLDLNLPECVAAPVGPRPGLGGELQLRFELRVGASQSAAPSTQTN
ncbi:MAG: hypothetical protein GXP55_03410 [Deltaproteobacteria bacterium]|nr:hypothetical protein [Deltaproteobacteria bacterium]